MKADFFKITFITFSFGLIFGKNNQNVIPDLKLNMLDGEKKSIHELNLMAQNQEQKMIKLKTLRKFPVIPYLNSCYAYLTSQI